MQFQKLENTIMKTNFQRKKIPNDSMFSLRADEDITLRIACLLKRKKNIPGPSSHSISVLKHCIPIVCRRPSTVSVYPKSMLLPHNVQSIRIDTFFLKID